MPPSLALPALRGSVFPFARPPSLLPSVHMETSDQLARRARRINRLLARLYPDAHCALEHRNPLQLLVATILSAQCTDARVNLVTPSLFARYPNARALAEARQHELEQAIASTGFFRNKARNIIACCQKIVEEHGGQVPRRMEELVALPGIGRKTANVILGTAFGVPGMLFLERQMILEFLPLLGEVFQLIGDIFTNATLKH